MSLLAIFIAKLLQLMPPPAESALRVNQLHESRVSECWTAKVKRQVSLKAVFTK